MRVAGVGSLAWMLLLGSIMAIEKERLMAQPECAAWRPASDDRRDHARVEAAGASIRFLPPYSPDFNPIEQAFAKLKAFLRAARPRTFDQVLALVKVALTLFTPDECQNYVRHCGYRIADVRLSKTL